jgi:hypothetical protein
VRPHDRALFPDLPDPETGPPIQPETAATEFGRAGREAGSSAPTP